MGRAMTVPLSRTVCDEIELRIRAGEGRNAIARETGVSAGSVTNVARARGVYFGDDWRTATATRAQQIDQEAAREQRKEAIEDEIWKLIESPLPARRQLSKLEAQLRRVDRNVRRP